MPDSRLGTKEESKGTAKPRRKPLRRNSEAAAQAAELAASGGFFEHDRKNIGTFLSTNPHTALTIKPLFKAAAGGGHLRSLIAGATTRLQGWVRSYMRSAAMAAVVAACWATAQAEPAAEVQDSTIFLRASVVVASPGERFQSCLGHVTIRMECPQHWLDYCFSFMLTDDTENVVRFFAGATDGKVMAIPTPDYLRMFADEGRGVEQHTLNLTTEEMQQLWMLLDNDIVSPDYRRFNFIANNCTSSALSSIERSVAPGERVEWGWPEIARTADNATGIAYITRRSPWMQFLCLLLVGTEGESRWDNTHRMSPELLVPLMRDSRISGAAGSRPLLRGESRELLAPTRSHARCPLTPTALFGALLALTLLVTAGQWLCGWQTAPRVLDAALLAAQTAAGLALCYMTFRTGLFGTHWNWMLIPLNPLPAILWALFRRREWWPKVYGVYAALLWAFVAGAWIWLSTIIAPMLLLTATLAARSTAKWLIARNYN